MAAITDSQTSDVMPENLWAQSPVVSNLASRKLKMTSICIASVRFEDKHECYACYASYASCASCASYALCFQIFSEASRQPRARRGQTRGHGEGAWETAPGEQLRTA